MKEAIVKRLSFGSYVKLFFLSGIGLGAIIGVFMLLIGLSGGPVTIHIGIASLAGPAGGIIGFVLSPILCGCVFAWYAVVSYLPFKLVMKIFKGIRFTALVEDASEYADLPNN